MALANNRTRGRLLLVPRHTVMLATVVLAALGAFAEAPPEGAKRPTLWVLTIGVSRYADAGLALRFAETDARSVAAALAEQRNGPLYGEVRTKTLVDAEVTRASILQTLEAFLGQAAPSDLGVIYIAGHGMHDAATDSYYFLPATASGGNVLVEGLDMAEFERQVRRLNRNIGSLVVVLDTCYAGALADGARDLRVGEDLAARLAPMEGLYILAAAQSGEQSRESATLGHGAFTKTLIDGLQGAAADSDGLIRVLGLASYAARAVPQLTEGRQHPYYRIVGGNPVLAARLADLARITPPPLPEPLGRITPRVPQRERIAVMRFENLRNDPEHQWMEKALGEEFVTTLNLVTQLDVYAEPEVRFVARGANDPFEAARQAGMAKIVSGAFAVQQNRISITAHVKDVESLKHLASAKIDGPLDTFFELRSRIVLDLLEHLRLELPASEVDRILKPGSTNLEARKLLFDAEGGGAEGGVDQPTPQPKHDRHGTLGSRILDFFKLVEIVHAAELQELEAEIRSALDAYRATYERKNLGDLSAYYVELGEAQRRALERYLSNADDLRIVFSDVRITLNGDQAAVSFTREDHFVDHRTGERQQVVVRLTKLLAKRAERWQIMPER